MNKYLEKIANQFAEQEKRDGLQRLGVASGIGGAALAGSTLTSKGQYELSGRHTYYHGTTEENANKIMNDGLKPRHTRGVIDALSQAQGSGKFADKNNGLVFADNRKSHAKIYADQAERIKDMDHDSLKRWFVSDNKVAAPQAAAGLGKGKVLKIKAPKAELLKHKVSNPEYSEATALEKLFMGGDKVVHDQLEKPVLTHKGDIPAQHIAESPHYKGITPTEVIDHWKSKPTHALKFGGRILGGAGLVGLGAKLIHDNRSK